MRQPCPVHGTTGCPPDPGSVLDAARAAVRRGDLSDAHGLLAALDTVAPGMGAAIRDEARRRTAVRISS